jgi:hypothetical protein
MPVIPVNKVVDPKRIIGKMEGQGGGEAHGVADQKKLVTESEINEITPGPRPNRSTRCRRTCPRLRSKV